MRNGITITARGFRRVRAGLFLTQREMAAAIGLSASGVQRIEHCRVAVIRPSTFRRLADLVGISATELAEQLSPSPASAGAA